MEGAGTQRWVVVQREAGARGPPNSAVDSQRGLPNGARGTGGGCRAGRVKGSQG